jgi:predicted DsbA family dithiol-disulfide isomerase
LKKEYAIADNWVSYELHPETPPAGVLLSERFKGYDLSSFYEQLNARGLEVGIVFGNRTLLSNSKSALMASEFARDLGRYDAFHENIFRAYFTDGMDIGNLDVIAAVAGKSGLEEKEIRGAVVDGRYLSHLNEAKKEGQLINLTGVPTFIIGNKYKIVGAQPIDVFRNLLDKAKVKS